MDNQSPEGAKLISFRDCFKELGNLKFASLIFVCSCILASRSSCLYRAADFGPFDAKFETNYARLLRFFSTGVGDLIQKGVFRSVLQMALSSGEASFLAMDRTDWKHGDKWCNLLVVGLVFRGYLIPLVWVDIGHRGNSDVATRQMLLDRLEQWWPQGAVPLKAVPFLADREFAGEYWLLQLSKRGFAFVVRIKSNRKLKVWFKGELREKPCRPRIIGRYLRKKGYLSMEIVLCDELVCHLVCLPNTGKRDKEPYIYLLTSIENPERAGEFYRHRWSIETCFGHLKTNGFDLEAQGFDKNFKLEILMAIIVLLYTVCVLSGGLQEMIKEEPENLKKYQNGRNYRKKSIFRQGLSLLIAKIFTQNRYLFNIFNELNTCLSEFYTKTKIVV
jgi:Transposase DDE domain